MLRAYIYTGIVVFTWGTSLAVNKAVVVAEREGQRLSSTEVALWCIAVGWVALLLTLAVRGRLGKLAGIAGRGWVVLFAMGCFGWVGAVVALNMALGYLPLPDAVVINYLHPVFTVAFQGPVFSAIIRPVSGWEKTPDRSHRPGPLRMAAGLAICVLGVAVIASEGNLSGLGTSRSVVGALAALTAALSWGIYSNLGRFVVMRPGRDESGLSDIQTFVAMTFGLALLGGWLAATGRTSLPNGYHAPMFFLGLGPAQINGWVLIVCMGVAVYWIGFTLWLYALDLGSQTGQAHRLPPLVYLSPVLGVAAGWVLLHEGFGPGFLEGAGLIVVGNAVNLIGGRKRTS